MLFSCGPYTTKWIARIVWCRDPVQKYTFVPIWAARRPNPLVGADDRMFRDYARVCKLRQILVTEEYWHYA